MNAKNNDKNNLHGVLLGGWGRKKTRNEFKWFVFLLFNFLSATFLKRKRISGEKGERGWISFSTRIVLFLITVITGV